MAFDMPFEDNIGDMSPEAVAFAKKLAEGARAKAVQDQRRLEAIRQAKAERLKAAQQPR
jgi:hypothetical protein